MAMNRVEAISRSYQEGMDSTPVDLVVIGMIMLFFLMIGGYLLSKYIRRRRFQKRQEERLKDKNGRMER